jgi:transcriptional regulator PpsR
VIPLESPWPSLGDLDARSAKTLLGLGADVTLLLDPGGKVLDLTCGDSERLAEEAPDWVGKDWVATVSTDSRARLASLLREATVSGVTRWVQVRHQAARGADIPVQYRAAGIDDSGYILAVGREMLAVASLQQQLVDAQQALERDYWRYREMEMRYRLLLRLVGEGTLIVEAGTLRVIEANPAADQLLGHPEKGLVGKAFPEGFDAAGTNELRDLLARLAPGAPHEEVQACRLADGRELAVSVSLAQQGQTRLYLIRLAPLPRTAPAAGPREAPCIYDPAVESAPDCVLITDAEGGLLAANPAFFRLVQIPPSQPIAGESLERWLGRPGIDLKVLISNLKQYGTLRLFRTSLHGEVGASTEVEISAAKLEQDDRQRMGFFVRDVGRRLGSAAPAGDAVPQWLAQLTERVGNAPLKELVRESTEQIERLCIEAALKLTGDNRASAAELLGLSRQSLYVKLARYGLGASAAEEGG